ncbi:unnamed protein product [Rotaria sordida]|uniref:Uncharacterized protein n=1 Tax=Rotaria sordida TaxID=392033 RepID=A0A815T1P0_9BILA|nr:unnamed protein product [Rotaria sordida]CAF4160341.1 unnamed protein product [Rotaria sordida]
MSSDANPITHYYRQVEQLDLMNDKNSTLIKCLSIILQCRRMRELNMTVRNSKDISKEDQQPASRLSKLSRLTQIVFRGSILSDLDHFLLILNAASNLFRLDMPIDYLLQLMEDQQITDLLRQRIMSLSILGTDTPRSTINLKEEHIPTIASVFSRLCDLYVDITHPPLNTQICSEENLSLQSYEQNSEVISPLSSQSMILCLLKEFKEYKLIGLCIDGNFDERLKTNAEQWLRIHTNLCEQQFEAIFNNELNRLLTWM